MRLLRIGLTVCLIGCSGLTPAPTPPERFLDPTPAVLALSDSILAAAGDRDAERFAGYFSDRSGFRYLINANQLESRAALRAAFGAMLQRQQVFSPAWHSRSVEVLTPEIAILTGTFSTQARRLNGEEWTASGAVTFVAVEEEHGWRVVNWHTSE
jgi:uncharacterized protein (TIGR02246 family)